MDENVEDLLVREALAVDGAGRGGGGAEAGADARAEAGAEAGAEDEEKDGSVHAAAAYSSAGYHGATQGI